MPSPGEPPTPPPPHAAPIQTAPSRIPLPPPRPAAPPAPRRTRPVLDYALAAVALGFAFLVASAPAHNSDLWLHLAAGRDLAAGTYRFGVDPLAQDTGSIYWVNANWLYDVLSYAVFHAAGELDGMGGVALVLLKALLVAALAAVLMRLGWCGWGLWGPAVGAVWAVLVLCPWLALQPVVVSYLFLALTLYFLERPRQPTGVPLTAYWPLLPLFVLWVNLDSWFLLGPLTVALYLAGQALQAWFGPAAAAGVRKGEIKALGLTFIVSLAACLLNPHHVHVFLTPPVQLGLFPAAHVLREDSAFQALRLAPFSGAYMQPGGPGRNAAGWAYFLLVALGGLSFLLNHAGWRWRRVLVGLALFLLSAFQVRAIPFFAVAAGPMLALNVQEALARRFAARPPSAEAMRWAVSGRVASLLAGLALLVIGWGWPGWLHAPPWDPPRWEVEADPGLRQMAEWRRDAALDPHDAGFNLSTDAANYCAWFCPQEKSVLDARLSLFSAETAMDFVTVRKELSAPEEWANYEEAWKQFATEALAPENGADAASFGGRPMAKVRDVLRRRGAHHLIVYDTDREKDTIWVQRLLRYPDEWRPLRLGRASVFGWCDPAAARSGDRATTSGDSATTGAAARDGYASLALDLDRGAYRPDSAKAPPAGPGRQPAQPDWTDPFLRGRPGPSSLGDEAEVYLQRFDQVSLPVPGLGVSQYGFRTRAAWQRSLVAGAVGAAAATGSVVVCDAMTVPLHVLAAGPAGPVEHSEDYKPTPAEQFAYLVRDDFRLRHDDGPVGLLYLALRAARRAVHDDPDDAHAYLILGEVYQRFLQNTAERAWHPARLYWGELPERAPLPYRVRTAEAIAAYRNALRANPDLEEAHMGLLSIYQDLNYQDDMLEQLQETLRCARQAGRRPNERPEDFAARIAPLGEAVKTKETEVKDRLEKFAVESANQPVYDRAALAVRKYGLAGKALSILLPSDVANFGPEGTILELELMLQTGQLTEVRRWPDPDDTRKLLGPAPYLEIQVQLEAASGNYQQADAELAEMIEVLHAAEGPAEERIPPRAGLAMAVGNALLQSLTVDGSLAYTARAALNYPKIVDIGQAMADRIVREADLTALRGSLALEAGEVDSARDYFRAALAVWGNEDLAAAGGGLDFPSRAMAQAGLAVLEKAGR
jgi:tetratricopeptide (TPR) repeat protein